MIGDARRDSYFQAEIRGRLCVAGPTLVSRDELGDLLQGDVLPVYTSEPLAEFPEATMAFPCAERLGRIAAAGGSEPATAPLEPLYLREPHITVPKVPF